ncbi:phage tail spike protein [Streptococcus suis]|uniref:phage tail spike protein n=1 Tax=Streptococcus suis TaxID=1307 RepID=UPI002E1168C2|nr:phage tail spike protein [Streptococcus suis]
MLYLLDKDVKTVKWNGIPLHEASSAIVKEETNGDFYITVRYPITDSSIYQLIKEDMLIKAPTPVLGPQLFRIKKPVENDDSLDITAYHITDDVMQRSITPVSVVGQGCVMALSQMVQNAKTDLGTFSFTSDIMDSRTFNTTETETLYTVLMDGKHSIVGTWEAELVRDNFALTIKRSRGADRGVVITTHKNLKSYQRTKNSQSVVTRIHAKSTFKAEGAEQETTINVTVDSPLIGNYPYINEKDYENNNAKTVDELRKWAEAKFKNEGIDKISDAIEIEAYELDGQVIHLGDTVNIKSRKHDVDLYKKAIAYEYNALTEKYISITFDDKPGVGGSGVSSGVSNAADVILGVNANAQEVAIERAVRNANRSFDAEFDKRVEEINDGIEQSKAEAEAYADNIKQSIDTEIAQVNQSMQAQSEEHDRQVADILSKTQSVESLANQAKTDAASAITQALQSKDEAIADARAQVATVSQALNTAKADLQNQVNAIDAKAGKVQSDANALRTDLNLQASKILAQAQAQTALTNRVTTVETLADGTRSTVAELSKTVNKATGDIASVTSRTKTVEDTLSQTRTQYEALTQTVNAQTGQIDSINRKTADLQSGIDGVTERFENLRVGARNYAEDYDFSRGMWEYSQGDPSATERSTDNGIYTLTTTTNTWHQLQIHSESGGRLGGKKDSTALLELEVGETYTLSVEVKANSGSPKFWLELRDNGLSNYNGVVTHLGGSRNVISATSEWVRYSVTGTVKPNSDFGHRRIILGYSEIGSVSFRKVELSRGTKPMDTGPAVEDNEGRVETLRSEFGTYIRNATENSAELVRRIETADGKAVDAKNYAQQTATAINTRLESLETYKDAEGTRASQYFTASRDETARQVTALRTAVTDGYVAKAKYEEDARGVTQRFESLQVGGRNYIRNFGFTDSSYTLNNATSQWRYERIADPTSRSGYHVKATCTQAGSGGFHRPFVDLRGAHWQGRTMTYAVDVKCSRSVTIGIGAEAIESGIKNQSVSTEWQRFAVTGKVKHTSTWSFVFYIRNTQWQVGDVVYIRDPQLEDGTMATTPSPAPEDQQSYADTKIAEYSNTIDGRFATMQSQVSGKANQVDLQTVRETVNLYERIIGSTEAGIKDKVARMVMTDSLFLTEVKDKISGTATQVSQLNNSYAIKNLTSAGTVLNQINLLANGTNRIDGRLTHITGQTLIDNGVIKNAMIGNLDAGKITTGTLDAARIKANSIDGSKMVFDQAFVNKMTANEALFKQLFAQSAFITSVQAVAVSAKQIAGGIAKALNGGMDVNFDESKINFYTNVAAIRRIYTGHPTQFIKFETEGNYSRTIIGSNRNGGEVFNSATFAGIVVENTNNINTEDNVRIYGDNTLLRHAQGDVGWNINSVTQRIVPANINAESEIWSKHFVAPDKNSKPVRLDTAVAALWDIWNHIIYNNFEFNEALRTHIKARRDNWKFELNL